MFMDMKKRSAGKRGWLTMEHAKFLMALEIEGKGRWKAISSHIDSKSSKQVQSHAQKYFLRQKQDPTTKKKTSIHDFTYTKLEEQFSGEYLRRLKYSDPQTYHLFYRYKMSRHQKNPLLYDPPHEGFEDYSPHMEGKGFQGGMFVGSNQKMFPASGMNMNMNMNMGMGMNMNMGSFVMPNAFFPQPVNPQPPMNQHMNMQYQQQLQRVPILDPKGRELITRNHNSKVPLSPPNSFMMHHQRQPPFQQRWGGQGQGQRMGRPGMGYQQPQMNFRQRSSPQRSRQQPNHQHYIQYTPDGDFQPVDDDEANDVEMRDRPILNPINLDNFNKQNF